MHEHADEQQDEQRTALGECGPEQQAEQRRVEREQEEQAHEVGRRDQLATRRNWRAACTSPRSLTSFAKVG